jgi:hypothetical protein
VLELSLLAENLWMTFRGLSLYSSFMGSMKRREWYEAEERAKLAARPHQVLMCFERFPKNVSDPRRVITGRREALKTTFSACTDSMHGYIEDAECRSPHSQGCEDRRMEHGRRWCAWQRATCTLNGLRDAADSISSAPIQMESLR